MKRSALCLGLLGLLSLEVAQGSEPVCTVRAQDPTPIPDVDPYDSYKLGKLQRLARKKDARALNALGIRYGTGDGVALDPVKSFNHYQAAADLGLSTAQANLAYMFLAGEGTASDPTLAFSWARKSAEVGNAQGLEMVGYLLATGSGVERNPKEAAYCYLLSARRGNVQAQDVLSTIYREGLGVPIDRRQAVMWLDRANAEAERPWTDPTPDPPMPPEWDSPFDFVDEIPGNARLDTPVYGFDVSLGDLSAKWEHYKGRGGNAATALRTGLPGYDTVVVSVIPREKLKPSENLLAAARRLQPNLSYAPVPGKKLCVRTSRSTPVSVSDDLLAYVAYCVRPKDRTVFELTTSWKSMTLQVGAVNATDTAVADLKQTMDRLLHSFTFK